MAKPLWFSDEKTVYRRGVDARKLHSGVYLFTIGGSNSRMIAFIEFRDTRMCVKHICSHAEYDRLTDKYHRNKE